MRTCLFAVWCFYVLARFCFCFPPRNESYPRPGYHVAGKSETWSQLASERKFIITKVMESPLCIVAALIMNRNSLPSRGQSNLDGKGEWRIWCTSHGAHLASFFPIFLRLLIFPTWRWMKIIFYIGACSKQFLLSLFAGTISPLPDWPSDQFGIQIYREIWASSWALESNPFWDSTAFSDLIWLLILTHSILLVSDHDNANGSMGFVLSTFMAWG